MSTSAISLKKFLLSDQLPYDTARPKANIATGLREYRLLLNAATHASLALRNGDFAQFDALVGENACQIRALKIAMTAPKLLARADALDGQLEAALRKIEAIHPSVIAKAASLEAVLEQEGLHIELSEEENFLLQSYLLTAVKVAKPRNPEAPLLKMEATEPRNLKRFEDTVSGSFTMSLVKKLRQELSIASVGFIQQQARDFPGCEPLVSGDMVVEHNGSRCLPFFFENGIIIRQAMAHQIPVVMRLQQVALDQESRIVGESYFLFTPRGDSSGYRRSLPRPDDLRKPAFVVEGMMSRPFAKLPNKRELRDELSKHDFVELFLTNSASHRQFPDPSKDVLVEGHREYEASKLRAEEIGCSLDNPSLFFINHVFCTRVGASKELARQARLLDALPIPLQKMGIADTIFSYLKE